MNALQKKLSKLSGTYNKLHFINKAKNYTVYKNVIYVHTLKKYTVHVVVGNRRQHQSPVFCD